MEILFLVAGLFLGLLIGWLWAKQKQTTLPLTNDTEQYTLLLLEKTKAEEGLRLLMAEKEKGIKDFNADKEKWTTELRAEREQLMATQNQLAKTEEAFRNLQERLNNEKLEVENLQKKFSTEFENVANRLLEEKSKRFTEQNKTNLDNILNPLRDKIKDFEEKVDKSFKVDSEERINLKSEIKYLIELNKKVGDDANNLANALKGNNKMQGNWGEIILEKILERSGLINGHEYKTQVNTTSEEGRRLQPDVVIYLPDNKHIVVDAKVSLVAYEGYVNALTEDDRERYKKAHIDSVKSHVKLLGDKDYTKSIELNTLEFVLLFLPIESSFSVAIQADNDLFNYAWDKRIVIVSPSTLLATLKTVSTIWKQERQTRNALQIAEEGGKLYDKFVSFVEDLLVIGKKLNETKQTYDESMKKLYEGSGNLVRRTEKLRELGAKTSKTLPQQLIDKANDKLL